MKKHCLVAIAAFLYSASVFSQAELSVIKTDKEFAALSYEKGMAAAFEKYLDDSVVFLSVSPMPIKGKQNFLNFLSKIKATVIWQPTGGAESADGTMAYTYGLSKWVYPVGDSLNATYYLYSTNWKKNDDNEWKLVSDIGTEYSFDKPPALLPADSFKVPSTTNVSWLKALKGKGFTVRPFTFASARAGNVPGILVMPQGKNILGVALFQHGLGPTNHKEKFLDEAKLLAQEGIAGIMIDAPFARKGDAGFIEVGSMRDGDIFRNNVTEWMQLLNMLPALSLDNKPVAAIGHSYGARVASMIALLDKRVKHVVFMAGIHNYAEWMQTTLSKDIEALRNQIPPEGLKAYLNSVLPYNASAMHAKKNDIQFFMQAPGKDEYMNAYDFLSSYIILNGERKITWYDAGHSLNEAAMQDRKKQLLEWFRAK